MKRFKRYEDALKAQNINSAGDYLLVEYNKEGDKLAGFIVCDLDEALSKCTCATRLSFGAFMSLGANEARLLMLMSKNTNKVITLLDHMVNSLKIEE